MKRIVLGCLLLLIVGCADNKSSNLKQEWKSGKDNLSIPESAIYDKRGDVIYVSNVNSIKSSNPWADNSGFISKLDKSGKVIKLKWAIGLKAPKGLAIYKNHLFASDLNQVVEIDTTSGKILNKFLAPTGINRLNDIACREEKEICFVSDSGTKKLFEVSLKSGKFKLIYDKEKSPKAEQNGLFINNNNLIMQGEVGELKSLNLDTKKVTILSHNVNFAIDGVTKYRDKGYIVSTWSGGIYFIYNSGDIKKILGDKFNTADIFYSKELDLLLVPDFAHNIIGYKIKDM